MINLAIDLNACTACGACVRACPAFVIGLDEGKAIEKYPDNCIACGHCIAVCPVDAIQHVDMDPSDFIPVTDPGITLEQFNQLGRNRRSIRQYKKEPVSREDMEKLLESARYAPTGENAQELQYTVISDPERIASIREFMAGQFKMLRGLAKAFYGFLVIFLGRKEARRMKSTLDRTVDRYEKEKDTGFDPYLRSAPTLVVIHTRHKTAMAKTDAGIAGYHMILAAQTMRIASVWNGFLQVFCGMSGKARSLTLVPKKHTVLACICFGYPSVQYKKTCARRPLGANFE